MIEMLGVLAIIGVLSAGGIMGYSTAMENYKVNKFIDDLNLTAANAKTFFLKNGNPSARINLDYNQLRQAGILPAHYTAPYKGVVGGDFAPGKNGIKGPFIGVAPEYWNITDAVTGKTLTFNNPFVFLGWYLVELSVSNCVKILQALPYNDNITVTVGVNEPAPRLADKPSVAKAEEFCASSQGQLAINSLISGRKTVTMP